VIYSITENKNKIKFIKGPCYTYTPNGGQEKGRPMMSRRDQFQEIGTEIGTGV
jgi:hypothetical protein